MAVPRNYYESDMFDWRHVRQVALANSGFHVLHELGTTKAEGSIAFTENEHTPTKGVALVLHCATPKTGLRFAAAYRTLVPSAKVSPICGAIPNIGSRITGGRSVLPSSGNLKEALPEKTDVQSQSVRLAACKAARDFKLTSDEAQECMKKPSKFKVSCSLTRYGDHVARATSSSASNEPTCAATKRRGHVEPTQWPGICAGRQHTVRRTPIATESRGRSALGLTRR